MEESQPKPPGKFLVDESFDKIRFILRWTGLPLRKGEDTAESFKLYYVNFIFLTLLTISGMAWFVEGAKRGESLTSLTYVAPCFTITFIAHSKTICLITYRKHLYNMITALKMLETNERQRPRTHERDGIITKEMTLLKLALRVLYIINLIAIISFSAMPLVLMSLKYIKTNEIELMLPLLMLYPFDKFNPKIYPFVYLNQVWSIYTVVMEVFCADAILYIFCSHITMHFQLLAYEVKQIADTSSNTSERADFKTRFKELITTHLRVVFLVNELELVYCKSTLMNFMVSSALICLTGFNVTALEDVAFVITFIGFLFITLLQVFFLCFFGEMVMNASEDICDSMYNSKWYTIDAKSAKMLLMVQIRSQRPSKLTAYGFADVNLRGFMKILSTSWSYFALLHSVYTRDAEN